ncbi:MAG: PEP-CTERM sorting domain-containing protein [Steroidobacteraceae bacterium]
MFTRFSQLIVATAVIGGAMSAGTASAGPIEMFLTSGGQSTSVLIGNTGDPSSVSYSGTLNGWTITSGTGGTSYAPGLNTAVGIDLGGYTATCVGVGGCSKDPLTIAVSATGFTTPIDTNGFLMELSGNVHGGQVTSSAYWDTADTYFCNAGNGAGNDCGSCDLIHSLTLGEGSGSNSALGGPDTIRSYSLTVVDTFSAGLGGDPSYSVDTTVTQAVPEPTTLALFGAGLLGCAWVVSRRRRARQ